jgi:hypothetical protein
VLEVRQIDPMKTQAAKWADSPLAGPTRAAKLFVASTPAGAEHGTNNNFSAWVLGTLRSERS